MIVFIEKCSLHEDRLGRTSECFIEVEQKGGKGADPLGPPSGYAPGHSGNYYTSGFFHPKSHKAVL